MSGFWNNRLIGTSKFQKAVASGTLYDYGAFPAMTEGSGAVYGEVYEINDAALARLDQLEGHPNFYQRMKIKVILESGEQIDAWTYRMKIDTIKRRCAERIESGDWRTYIENEKEELAV